MKTIIFETTDKDEMQTYINEKFVDYIIISFYAYVIADKVTYGVVLKQP